MSVRKRGKTWEVRLTVDGRKIGRTAKTWREAKALEAELRKDKPTGAPTVGQYAGRWLELHPPNKTSTANTHTKRLSKFVAEFGDTPLNEVKRRDLREWAVENNWRMISVQAFFSAAFDDELIEVNPAVKLGLKASRREVMVTKEAEVHHLADTALQVLDDEWGPLMRGAILVSAFTAIRPGELFALEWDCVGEDTLAIVKTFSQDSLEETLPKNGHKRLAVLPPFARDALPPRRLGTEYVFADSYGAMRPNRFRPRWHIVREAVGRPTMTYYELRHACGSKLARDGFSGQDAAKIMGHRDGGSLWMSVYSPTAFEDAKKKWLSVA